MKSHISKMRVTALAVGLAIVMSSCGIQNQAGDSSSAPAAGKTKNFALLKSGAYCFDDRAEQQSYIANIRRQRMNPPDAPLGIMVWISLRDMQRADERLAMFAQIGNCPKTAIATSADVTITPEVVQNSTENQCISVADRKSTLKGYDEQIAFTKDKMYQAQMLIGRAVTVAQRPCDEYDDGKTLSALACVPASQKAFEVEFYADQYELHKDKAGTPYLDLIIIGKEKANALITC
jgi:hypothetical protein